MRTRSSYNLPGESPPNPYSSSPKCRNHRRSKQPFFLEESPIDTMADQRTRQNYYLFSNNFKKKAVEEICVTCGGAHPYYHCLVTDGNTFPELWDNIQGYVSAATVNYNQGNSGYRPPGVANQIRSSGFTQLNVQNNQNWFSQPHGYNRGNNFNKDSSYQAPMQQNQVVPLKMDEKLNSSFNVQSTNELKNMMASFFQMNIASTLGLGSLPSNTITNPKGELKAITTRSGIVLDGPSVPILLPFINPEEDERVEETLTDQNLTEYTIKVPPPLVQKPKPHSQINFAVHQRDPLHSNIPYHSRMHKQKQQEKDKSPLHLGKTFLTDRALIDVHGEEMILRDGDERLTLNMRHDTSSYSNQPQKNQSTLLISSMIHISPPYKINPLSGNTTFSSPSHLLEEFADELALITFPPGNDDLSFDIESDLKEIEYLLNHDPIKDMDSILKDSVDEDNLVDLNDNLVDTMPEMFTDKHDLDYSFPPERKSKSLKLLIDELDLPRSSDFLLSPEYDSFLFEDFSEVDALPSTNNEDKDFDPPLSLYELPFLKEVPGSETPLSFSSKNEEKVFKPGILTSKGVHASLLPELSHRGPKAFKVTKIVESPMEIFPCSFGEDIRILVVPCLNFYPL
nr:hypothetical protein [Tanacetum cinerariifolium]